MRNNFDAITLDGEVIAFEGRKWQAIAQLFASIELNDRDAIAAAYDKCTKKENQKEKAKEKGQKKDTRRRKNRSKELIRIDNDFDEIYPAYHTDLVLVTQGFHSTAAAPGCNIYFLNYLAGELLDDARGTPPYDDPAYAWMKHDWDRDKMTLPVVG